MWRGHTLIFSLVGLVILSLILTAGLLLGIAQSQDRRAAEQSIAFADAALARETETLTRMSNDYADWGDAYRHLHQTVDTDWAFDQENFGPSLKPGFNIDYVLVIRPGGETVYGVVDGKLMEPPTSAMLTGGLAELIERAQQVDDEALHAEVGILGLLGQPGRPVLVAAEKLATGNDPTVEATPGPPSVAIFGTELTPERLAALGGQFFLDGLRLAGDGGDAAAAPSRVLHSVDGSTAFTLRWDPAHPGATMLRMVVPWLALGGLLLVLLTWLVVRYAMKSAALLEAGTVRLAAALAQAEHIAVHDFVTGLPNRRGLVQAVGEMLARRDRGPVTFAFVDVDRFKLINDSLGHPTGDRVLSALGQRLRAAVSADDLVARTGGDEFVVVTTHCADRAAAEQLCRTITEIASSPIALDSGIIHLTLSIGVTHVASRVASADELLRQADIAMYRAKAERRGSHRFFDHEMHEEVVSRRALENDLRDALARGEFVLHYQPRFEAATLTLRGVETLLRWQHPVRGLVGPEGIIEVAEDTGLIYELGAWVLRNACLFAAQWPGLTISVNVSTLQLLRGDLPELVQAALRDAGIAPARLELELTESVMFEDRERSREILNELKSLGIRLAVDDFGTGFSSLGYLMYYPFDCLKIDRSFISNLEPEGGARAIVQAMMALGRALNLAVVAEGVETEGQLRLVQTIGCDEVQGFYLSRPLTAGALAEFIRAYDSQPRRA
ncbi:bifunctional diguanylate cyclase/phosphodiesterase [Oleomonas cavernae]|uniref:Bifunctional diguanylate cyclase/phosphodiesterase n=1 Tax=Oleomonas cavernae TaxID=2320859 RepID=A0A418W9W3_9PROT|nr:bifunctional diguanylate cyclase/phosphodiesterase [Oleomonas cavernae]RJF86821.1 bifunctional diguanylate cyclase/phosphodiesterase [Oleomonas cavernae]